MADQKLSALTELAATPANDDEVYIRDVSEAASAESKRITVANLQDHTPKAHTLDSHSASRIGKDRMEWTAAKLLLGAGTGSDPTEIDVPGGDHYPLTRYLLSGRYHCSSFLGATIAFNSDANTLYAYPFITPIARTVTRMAVHVTTGLAGNTMFGIYEDNGSIYPGNLLSQAGIIDSTSTGLKEVTGLSISLSANTLYWLATNSDVGPILAATDDDFGWSILGFSLTELTGVGYNQYWKVDTYDGTLTDPYPAGATKDRIQIIRIGLVF